MAKVQEDMKKESWVVLSKDRLLQIASEPSKRGQLYLSAYDLPSKLHLVSEEKTLTIEFVYADSEPGKWVSLSGEVEIQFGQHSNKVLALRVPRQPVNMGQVQRAVKKAPPPSSAPIEDKDRLQRKTINAVLDENKKQIEDMVPA